MSITIEQARKVLSVIDAGLCYGKGVPTPGQMCVEAAVCYGLGLPFGDDPECVEASIRTFKINLNDKPWSSSEARAKGLRRIGIAQLGSKGTVDGREFVKRLAEKVIRVIVPIAMEAAAIKNPKHAEALRAAGERCKAEGTKTAAYAAADAVNAAADAANAAYAAAYAVNAAAYAAADAAYAAAYAAANAANAAYAAANAAADAANAAAKRDEIYTLCANLAVDVLRDMNAPGIALMDEVCG
jgi:hypothetical protein